MMKHHVNAITLAWPNFAQFWLNMKKGYWKRFCYVVDRKSRPDFFLAFLAFDPPLLPALQFTKSTEVVSSSTKWSRTRLLWIKSHSSTHIAPKWQILSECMAPNIWLLVPPLVSNLHHLTLLPHSVLGLFPVALQPPPVVRSYREGTVGLDRLAGSAGTPSSHGDVPVETLASFKSCYFLPLSRGITFNGLLAEGNLLASKFVAGSYLSKSVN